MGAMNLHERLPSGWDTLFSWNTYAEIWASGEMPRVGGMYPQLVPANWSLSYLLQGENPVQFFNALIPPVFFLLIQLMLFDLGFSKKEYGYFIAAVISRYMMKKLLGDGLFDGYMDVPAAAMVLLSVYCIVKAEGKSAEHQSVAIFRAVVFASGAAVTKQSGLVQTTQKQYSRSFTYFIIANERLHIKIDQVSTFFQERG
jgi:hypothetical protein